MTIPEHLKSYYPKRAEAISLLYLSGLSIESISSLSNTAPSDICLILNNSGISLNIQAQDYRIAYRLRPDIKRFYSFEPDVEQLADLLHINKAAVQWALSDSLSGGGTL